MEGKTRRTLQLGLPVGSLAEAVLAARDAGEERISLALPLDLVQAALATAMPEVAGHQWDAGSDEPIVLELDDEQFDVMGWGRRL
jgi:NAD(P)H-hydrate repair Nnr-like enzyme with NAD(P)H-hydrate dehydratase domain